MAIMVIHDAPGFTPQDYELVRATIGWESRPPPGGFMHLLGHDADGLLNIELWESEDLYDAYVRDRFLPAFDRLGLAHPPPPRVMFIHNALQLEEAVDHVPRAQRTYA